MVETGKFNLRSDDAKKATETVGKKLATAAGSRAARSIASIHYQFPENLLPEQLLALGVSYFKVKDDEKAAVILNFLTELEDDKSFRNAANYLMAGIAFYRLEHFKNAAEYFERVGKLTETDEETQKAKRQAIYWQALVAERTKNRGLAQKLILDSLEKDPLTKEARWVNPQGETTKSRLPASVSGEKETEESHEGQTPEQD
jgi:tetratricopeptide (TPR) repeat protein